MADRPLSFCMITTYYPPYNFGGDGIFVQRLSNELANRGHSVEVVHCVDSARLKSRVTPSEERGDHKNVRVHSLRSSVGPLSPIATQQMGEPFFKKSQLSKIFDKKFDVIHYHNISLVGGPGILRYGSGVKLYTTHEYWLVCPTHLMFKFNSEPCVEPSCFACTLVHRRPPQWWRYTGALGRGIKEVDAFLSPTRFGIELHQRMGFTGTFKHLPLFVPDAQVEAEKRNADHSPFFLYAGRLEEVKGLQTVVPLFQRRTDAELLVAGTGSYEARLRQLAAGANVRFLGQLEQAALQSLYRRAVALIVPSLCFEIFPLVMLEAFRHGTPVIARRQGGMAEMIDESGGGIAYDSDRSLVDAMDRLLANSELRGSLGNSGQEAYRRNWTAEVHLTRYLSLIEEIRSARGG